MASLASPAAGCVAALLLVSALTASATSAGDAPRPSLSNDPSGQADYVQIRGGKFELHGQPFVLRGVNYFGSWRFGHVFSRQRPGRALHHMVAVPELGCGQGGGRLRAAAISAPHDGRAHRPSRS